MTRSLADVAADIEQTFDRAEQRPRIPCTRCKTGQCLDLPWINRPICDRCLERIETELAAARKAEDFDTRRRDSQLPQGYWGARFRDFKGLTHAYADHQHAVSKRLWDVVHQTGPGLLLIGPPGCGKTHLLAAAANQLLLTTPLLWIDLTKLLYELGRSVFQKGTEPVEPYGKRLTRDYSVIFIDDFSFDKTTYDWAQHALRGFFNDLTAQGPHVRVFMTSNMRLDAAPLRDPVTRKDDRDQDGPSWLTLFGKPVVSRVKQLTRPVHFTGPDRRLEA